MTLTKEQARARKKARAYCFKKFNKQSIGQFTLEEFTAYINIYRNYLIEGRK